MMEEKLLTVEDLARRTGFKKSYFYNRDRTKAKTLKFCFERPLMTTEEFFQEWLVSLGKSKG